MAPPLQADNGAIHEDNGAVHEDDSTVHQDNLCPVAFTASKRIVSQLSLYNCFGACLKSVRVPDSRRRRPLGGGFESRISRIFVLG